jgi:Kelch motif protein
VKAHLIRGAVYLLLLVASCLIPFALAQRTTGKETTVGRTMQLPVTSRDSDRHATAVPTVEFPAGFVLWDQYNNPTTEPPINIGSQEFEPAMAAFDDQAADDFIVTTGPPGFGMCITSVRVMGEYSKGGGPASSFNVYIYTNGAGNLPGVQIGGGFNLAYTGTPPDFTINLPSPFCRAQGIPYWLSVQAVQDFNPRGQWFWHNRTVQSNSGAAWQNPGNGYGTGCTSWSRKNTCLPDQVWPDQVFQILGFFEGNPPSPTPTATPCASWTEQSPYPIVTSGQAVASVGGSIYSFGGIANNVAIANAYKYSPATNTWTPIASLPSPRGWFSGTTDGTYIYLLGGVDQNFNTTATLWRYDPVSNTYNTALPSYTIPTYFHASAYLNGKVYRIAGRAIGTDFHVEVYDIATNTWSMAANYPFANHSLMAAALGNYIYAGGGNASPDKTWRYDPDTNSWDDAAVADLSAGRSAAASGAYNGRWILAGGDVNFAISTSAIAWDPATNAWSNLPNMVQARDYFAGATAGQSFYAVAGSSAPGTGTNDNQQYTEIPCGTPSPTATATATATPTLTTTAMPTVTPTPTTTSTPTAIATATPTATVTPTGTPTSTPRPSPTPRNSPTPRPRPTPPPRP